MDKKLSNFANKIKIVRELLKYDQKNMSYELAVSQPTYSRIESGKSEIDTKVFSILFYKLNVSPLWFFYDIEPIFFSIDNSESNEISEFLQTHAILYQVKQKIKTLAEVSFWQKIISINEGIFELLSKALEKDFSKIELKDAKNTLNSTIESIPLNKIGFGINTYENDRKKVLSFINNLEDIECYIILTNAKEILLTINQSRNFLNRRL